jgi:hypothetical protein
VRRWWGEFARTPPNETGVVVEVEVLFVGLVFCVLVPQLLLLLTRRVLSRWALRNHQLYLERFLFL